MYAYQLGVYSDVHDQLPPPLEKYYFALVRGLASNRSERPCLAARTLLLADFATGLPPQCRAKFHQQLQRQRYIRVLATTIRGAHVFNLILVAN